MKRFGEIDRPKLIELLRERLAVEEANIRLYGRALEHVARAEPAIRRITPRLEINREEERDHARWLAAQLEGLGARPDDGGWRVRRVELERRGLDELAASPHAGVDDLLHALLVCERSDVDGWDALAAVAESAGDPDAHHELDQRRKTADEHATFLQRARTELLRNEMLGVPVTLPLEP